MSRHIRHVRTAGRSNPNHGSLVAVVAQNDDGEWVRPDTGAKFFINETAAFPEVMFEIKTDFPPPYQWNWVISWDAKVSGLTESVHRHNRLRTFSQSGSFSNESKSWKADFGSKILGGKLIISVVAGDTKFRRTVFILGKNPAESDVVTFLSTLPNTIGFDRVIRQESRFKNFINADNEPVVATDRGYGMTQLTTPAPTYEQVWNWKENVRGGVHLFQEKQRAAKQYLGQQGRHYTDDQLTLETITRWNGGAYHTWNAQSQSWERNADMLCDPATGNIGWNTTHTENSGQTEEQLHERDKTTYDDGAHGQSAQHDWSYTGICYADHIVHP